ncbi:MAG: 3-dehydroquinate synthase [Verrucomicrobiae bacterium]|nr:3-dehydroquinate synthase [Verrucomicrobiae bacterium]
MKTMHSTVVQLKERSYEILTGTGIFPDVVLGHSVVRECRSRILVIADSKLKAAGRRLAAKLGSRCAGVVLMKGGEKSKHIGTLMKLYAAAVRARLDRKSVVVAMGGGVAGDVSGFFAGTYLRGIKIVHVATTVIAQVDSAIGGKTGIDLPQAKNLVGVFHQPSLVVSDVNLLKTLPKREFRAGLAEVIKYGVIADALMFERLERRLNRILEQDPAELQWMIQRCAAIKARVVSWDERETKGLRAMLNFGHTIGHGIEAASHFNLLHGEAVALGMIGASRLSVKLSGLSGVDAIRIFDLIMKCGLPVRMPANIRRHAALAAMKLDKKAVAGQLRFVLVSRIGQARTDIPVDEAFCRLAVGDL